MEKLVYNDDGQTKVLRGKTVSEDNFFVTFKTKDNNTFKINKANIISIKTNGVQK